MALVQVQSSQQKKKKSPLEKFSSMMDLGLGVGGLATSVKSLGSSGASAPPTMPSQKPFSLTLSPSSQEFMTNPLMRYRSKGMR